MLMTETVDLFNLLHGQSMHIKYKKDHICLRSCTMSPSSGQNDQVQFKN